MAKLFVMRHAEAAQSAPTDAERPLTARGEQQCESAAQYLLANNFNQNDCITLVHSPYVRTTQTSKILLNRLTAHSINVNVSANKVLVESGGVRAIVQWLIETYENDGELADDLTLFLVSHQPIVADLVAWLIEGSSKYRSNYPMMPASLAELDLQTLSLIHI